MVNSYYGTYDQLKFTDVYDNADDFLDDWKNIEFYKNGLITDNNIKIIHACLYAKYGNSIIAASDIGRFTYNLFYLVFCYGPTWEKRLDIQEKLRGLTDSQIETGTRAIYNHARNPQMTPTTATIESLDYIDEQNTTGYKKSKMDAYAQLNELIETDVTEDFINRFKKLFLTVVSPQRPLLYEE